LYSEELITTCLSTVKNQLAKIIYPFVEASTDLYGHTSPLLRYLTLSTSPDIDGHRRLLAEIFQALSSIIPRINALVCADTISMSDTITIQAVYISIGPFFVVDSGEPEGKGKKSNVVLNTLGSSAMRGLRLEALALIRSVCISIIHLVTGLILFADLRQP
jgi:cohesin loading factor subunit SCC2